MIQKQNSIKKIFGILKNWKLDTQKFKDEIRRGEAIAEKRKFLLYN